MFRWASRANAFPAPSHEHEQRDLSPKTVHQTPPISLPQLSLPQANSGSFSPPRTLPRSPWLSEAAQVQALQRPADEQMNFVVIDTLNDQSPHTFKRLSGESRATLALEGKNKATKSSSSWNLFQRSKIENHTAALPDPAKEIIVDEEPSYFTQKPVEPPLPLTSLEETEEHDSIWPLRSLRKWFSKPPRNRKDTPSSVRTSHASTSRTSTLQWIGPNSPVSPAGGADDYKKRQEQACGAKSSYPANEAKPVTTPPVKQSSGGNPRSFFMDIKHPLPMADSESSSASSARVAPRVFSYRKGVDAERREWWDEPKALVRRDPVKGVSFFEFDMPEHLPSSPMCPANPMHRLKGKGVCVFHGRLKRASMDDEAGIAEEDLMESP